MAAPITEAVIAMRRVVGGDHLPRGAARALESAVEMLELYADEEPRRLTVARPAVDKVVPIGRGGAA